MSRVLVAACGVAAATGRAGAQSLDLTLLARFGGATTPFATAELPEANGHGMVAVVSGRVRFSPFVRVGARLPLAVLNVAQPAGSFVGETAWGNPELYVERELALRVADLPGTRAVGVAPVLAAGGKVWATGSLGLALDVHAELDAVAPVSWARGVSPLQLAVQPGLRWRLGAEGAVAADLLAPIGGALGGHAMAVAVGVAASL